MKTRLAFGQAHLIRCESSEQEAKMACDELKGLVETTTQQLKALSGITAELKDRVEQLEAIAVERGETLPGRELGDLVTQRNLFVGEVGMVKDKESGA